MVMLRLVAAVEGRTLMRQMTLEISIGGMSCASCVASLETALGRVPGVADVNVNLATERARIRYAPDVAGEVVLAAAIEESGYKVLGSDEGQSRTDVEREARETERLALRRSVGIAALFTIPIFLLDMVPMRGTMALDASSTLYRLTGRIDGARDLNIVTNGLDTFQNLAGKPAPAVGFAFGG
jgi:cation transport ATPase